MKSFWLTGLYLAVIGLLLVIDPIVLLLVINWLARIVGWGWQIPLDWRTILIGIIFFFEFRGFNLKLKPTADEQVE